MGLKWECSSQATCRIGPTFIWPKRPRFQQFVFLIFFSSQHDLTFPFSRIQLLKHKSWTALMKEYVAYFYQCTRFFWSSSLLWVSLFRHHGASYSLGGDCLPQMSGICRVKILIILNYNPSLIWIKSRENKMSLKYLKMIHQRLGATSKCWLTPKRG